MYPSPISYSLALTYIVQLCQFGFPINHSQQHFSNPSRPSTKSCTRTQQFKNGTNKKQMTQPIQQTEGMALVAR
jgi:hypothetical protein